MIGKRWTVPFPPLYRERERPPRSGGIYDHPFTRIHSLPRSHSIAKAECDQCTWGFSGILGSVKATGEAMHLSVKDVDDASSAGIYRPS